MSGVDSDKPKVGSMEWLSDEQRAIAIAQEKHLELMAELERGIREAVAAKNIDLALQLQEQLVEMGKNLPK